MPPLTPPTFHAMTDIVGNRVIHNPSRTESSDTMSIHGAEYFLYSHTNDSTKGSPTNTGTLSSPPTSRRGLGSSDTPPEHRISSELEGGVSVVGQDPIPQKSLSDIPPVPEVTIAVIGAKGSGKSTFINLVNGSQLDISDDSGSESRIAKPFGLDGRRVTLIDTPGFDDTTKPEGDMLTIIAAYIEQEYERGRTLHGVICMHDITKIHVCEVSDKRSHPYRNLYSDEPLHNVVIVTNMWNGVSQEEGQDRQRELSRSELFKPALDMGAVILPHENTLETAETILRRIIDKHPMPLRIQKDQVISHGEISGADNEPRGLAVVSVAKARLQEVQSVTRQEAGCVHQLQESLARVQEAQEAAIEEHARAEAQRKAEAQRDIVRMQQLQQDSARVEAEFMEKAKMVETALEAERVAHDEHILAQSRRESEAQKEMVARQQLAREIARVLEAKKVVDEEHTRAEDQRKAEVQREEDRMRQLEQELARVLEAQKIASEERVRAEVLRGAEAQRERGRLLQLQQDLEKFLEAQKTANEEYARAEAQRETDAQKDEQRVSHLQQELARARAESLEKARMVEIALKAQTAASEGHIRAKAQRKSTAEQEAFRILQLDQDLTRALDAQKAANEQAARSTDRTRTNHPRLLQKNLARLLEAQEADEEHGRTGCERESSSRFLEASRALHEEPTMMDAQNWAELPQGLSREWQLQDLSGVSEAPEPANEVHPRAEDQTEAGVHPAKVKAREGPTDLLHLILTTVLGLTLVL